jgi:hypothetical protein
MLKKSIPRKRIDESMIWPLITTESKLKSWCMNLVVPRNLIKPQLMGSFGKPDEISDPR